MKHPFLAIVVGILLLLGTAWYERHDQMTVGEKFHNSTINSKD